MKRTLIIITTAFLLCAVRGLAQVPATQPNPSQAGGDYELPSDVFEQNLDAKKIGLETIRARLIAHPTYISPDSKDPAKVKGFLAALNPQGEFIDLDSPDPVKNWIPALNRLNAIAVTYRKSPDPDRTAMRERMFAGIQRYCQQAVEHPDPFVGAAFGAPRNAAAIFYSLYDELNQPQRASARQALKDAMFLGWYYPIQYDPTRKTDPDRVNVFRQDVHFIVGNFTYRPVVECAVAMESTRMLDVVRAVTVDSLGNRTSYQTESNSFWGDEGMTMDGGGFAHGRQSYVFGYVRDWLRGVGNIARVFQGTPWEIEPTRWDYVADLILGSQQWFVYKNDIDWSIEGRHNMYPGLIAPGDAVLYISIDEVLDLSKGKLHRKDELLALRDRLKNGGEFNGNRYFWNSEDMVHRRDDYYLSVNLCSIRSDGPENAAPFSTVNYYLPYGSMMIKTRGDEYLRARGAMNCSALPGITSDPSQPLPQQTSWSGFCGNNVFCGGVSDGARGVCGFILQNNQPVSARKGYFFFDEGMVALGSAVTTGNVETTINQTEWRGPVQLFDGQNVQTLGETDSTTEFSVKHPFGICQDDVGYIVLPTSDETRIKLIADRRQTHWADQAPMNSSNPKAAVATVPMFQLSVLHANDSRYAYAVLPHWSASMAGAVNALPFEVLANSREVQAVKHLGSGVIEAIFYEPARINCGEWTLEVDQPAIVMFKVQGNERVLLVSDPLQQVKPNPLNIWVTLPISGENVRKEGGRYRITCNFPSAPWIGKAAEYHMKS